MISGPCLLNLVCFGRLNKPTAASHAHACILPCLAISSFVLLFLLVEKLLIGLARTQRISLVETWWKIMNIESESLLQKNAFLTWYFSRFPLHISKTFLNQDTRRKIKIHLFFEKCIMYQTKVSLYITFQYLDLRFIFKCFWRSVFFN